MFAADVVVTRHGGFHGGADPRRRPGRGVRTRSDGDGRPENVPRCTSASRRHTPAVTSPRRGRPACLRGRPRVHGAGHYHGTYEGDGVAHRGLHLTRTTRERQRWRLTPTRASTPWLSAPDSPACTCCIGCGSSVCGPGCWRRPKTSAAPGCSTDTRVHDVTSKASSTPTASAKRSAGMGLDGVDAGPARDRGLSQLRRRPAGSSPRHPVRHRGRRDDLRRGGGEWLVQTEGGEPFAPRLSSPPPASCRRRWNPTSPAWTLTGTSLFTSRCPQEGFELTGQRVGLIGTGSTGIQPTPVIAREASQLYVFQRSAAYTLPSRARGFDRRAGRDESPLRRDPRGAAGAPIGAAGSALSRCCRRSRAGRR